jgi:hypothetical protein
MTAEEAARKLRKSLRGDMDIQGIGYAKGADPEYLVIYTHSKPWSGYPAEYEGFRVEVRQIGKVVISPPRT